MNERLKQSNGTFVPSLGGTNVPKVAQYYNCLKKILLSCALRKLRKVSFVAVKRRN